MRQRCNNENHVRYADYGGRGIKVCPRWENSFENFWQDMGLTYQQGLTLERKENDSGYSKKNCYWATRQEQANNKRTTVWVDTPRGRMTRAQLARTLGVKFSMIRSWQKRGTLEAQLVTRL